MASIPAAVACTYLALAILSSPGGAHPGEVGSNKDGDIPLGNIIQSYFTSCLPHIVRYPTDVPLNYALLQVPATQYHIDSINDTKARNRLLWNIDERIQAIQRIGSIAAIRNFDCFLIMFSTSNDTFSDPSLLWPYNRKFLAQDMVFPCAHSDCRIMPYYFVGFMFVGEERPAKDWKRNVAEFWQELGHERKFDFHHPTPSYFFEFDSLGLQFAGSGCVYCWFCPDDHKLWEFNCGNDLAVCPVVMMDVYRNAFGKPQNVPWTVSQLGKQVGIPSVANNFCPFTLNSTASCKLDRFNRVLHFLISEFNWTNVTVLESGKIPEQLPRLSYHSDSKVPYSHHVLLTGETSAFRFITSDSVRQGGSSPSSFLDPFDSGMWLGLVVVLLTLAFCITGLTTTGRVWMSLAINVLSFASNLWDQSGILVRPKHRTKVRIVNLILICWFFTVIVITNSYKAFLKTSYVLEPTYETPWKFLKDLKSFEILFPFRSSEKKLNFLNNFYRALKTLCEQVGGRKNKEACEHIKEGTWWEEACGPRITPFDTEACLFFMEFSRGKRTVRLGKFKSDTQMALWWESRLKFLQNFVTNHRFCPVETLEQVVTDDLVHPRTAYVTLEEYFAHEWKVFEKVMKSTGVKFVGSDSGEMLGERVGWQMQSGHDGLTFGNVVWLRALAMMESGLYGLWADWDNMRKRLDEPELLEQNFVPLSFAHSDIYMQFFLCLGGLAVAFLALLAEILLQWNSNFKGICCGE